MGGVIQRSRLQRKAKKPTWRKHPVPRGGMGGLRPVLCRPPALARGQLGRPGLHSHGGERHGVERMVDRIAEVSGAKSFASGNRPTAPAGEKSAEIGGILRQDRFLSGGVGIEGGSVLTDSLI